MKILLTLFLLFPFTQSKSQPSNWAWARSAPSGTSGIGEGYGVATDALGNVYIGGSYHDSIIFGTTILPNFNGIFLAKYDSSGNVKWGKNVIGYGYGNNVATDQFGGVYLVGWFQGAALIFDSDTLANSGSIDMFLAKYDSSGNFLWAKCVGGPNGEQGFDVSTDLAGNVYVTGNYSSPTINFDSDTLTNFGASAVFLAKFDPLGNVLWARSAGGSSLQQGKGVATNSYGKIFITGYFNSPFMSFGSDTLINSGTASNDFFIAEYDSSGNLIWVKNASGNGNDQGMSVATDIYGNVYATGYFNSGTLSFANNSVTHANSIADVFLVKYDSLGISIWAKGSVTTTPGYATSYDIITDGLDRIYVTGRFQQPSASFDSTTILFPAGAFDPMFIAIYDFYGNALCARVLESGGDDQNSISIIPSGSIYLGGDLFLTSNPFIIGNDSLFLTSQENVFVAKLIGDLCPNIHSLVSDIEQTNRSILFPNPFQENIHITNTSNKESEVVLYDLLLRKLLEQTFTNSTTINTAQLADGIYIYEVRNKNGIIAKGKVIKQ